MNIVTINKEINIFHMELDVVKIVRSFNDVCETELVLKSGTTLNNPIKKVKFDSHRFRFTTR